MRPAHLPRLQAALSVALLTLLPYGCAGAAPSLFVDFVGSASAADVKGSYALAGTLQLWATELTGAAAASWEALPAAGGVRVAFTFPDGARFTAGKPLSAVVGDRMRAARQAALATLGLAAKQDKLDLGIAAVSVPPSVSFTVPLVAPQLDARRTKATGPTSAAIIFVWAPTNRPPARATFTLTPADGGAPLVVPAEFKPGGALAAAPANLKPAMRYSVAVTVVDKAGKTVANTVGTNGLPTLTTTSPPGLATAVRFTTVLDGYSRAKHDAQLMAQYKANLQLVAPTASIAVTFRSRTAPFLQTNYGDVILETLLTFPPGPTTDIDAETFASLLGRRNYFVYGDRSPNKYGDLFGDVAHLEGLLPPYKVLPDGRDPPLNSANPYLEPALLMTVASHDLKQHDSGIGDRKRAAVEAAMRRLSKEPFQVASVLFTDLLTAAGPDLTLCFPTAVASRDTAALAALAKLVVAKPGEVWPVKSTGVTDVREYSPQVRMVLKRG